MVTTTEIAPEIYRLAVFVPEINLEFSHFLVRDDEPLLFHAGLRGMFPLLREAVSHLIDISKLKHIGFSHFESDEEWGGNENDNVPSVVHHPASKRVLDELKNHSRSP